jgi:hypothetical protein
MLDDNECLGMVASAGKEYYSYTYKGTKYSPWTTYAGVIKVRRK